MTSPLPHDLAGLALMVFLLGLRHGMDPDHLATLDGLARHNAQARPRLARWSGCFFSLGHGAIVTLVAGFVAATLHDAAAPQWLERLGTWISIAFLLALGVMNITAVLRTPADRVVRLKGFKGRWLGRIAETGHPAVIAMIGAAFALSFDTLSQAALFSLTGAHLAGWPFSVALGLLFSLGMMTTDGVNGAWVSRIARCTVSPVFSMSVRRNGLASMVKSILLGAMVRRKMDFTMEARPFLRTLMEKTGETVHLAILDHDSILYIITHESKQALRMGSKVGTRAPVHSTAVGKTLLAFQPDEELERIIARGLPVSAPNTIVEPKALRPQLATARGVHYAGDDEVSEIGLRAIAAPIRIYSGNVVAAISIAGPVHRMARKALLGWVRELVDAAEAVSQRLGWQPPRPEALPKRA